MGIFDFFKKKRVDEEELSTEDVAAEESAESEEVVTSEDELTAAAEEESSEGEAAEEAAGDAAEEDSEGGSTVDFAAAKAKHDAEEAAEKRREAEKQADENGKVISYLISRFNDNRTQENMAPVMRALNEASLLVPMLNVLSNADMAALKASPRNFKPRDPVKHLPGLVKEEKTGALILPCYTNSEEIPAEQRGKMPFVRMPFGQVIVTAFQNLKIERIAVNPSSIAFVIPVATLEQSSFNLLKAMRARMDEETVDGELQVSEETAAMFRQIGGMLLRVPFINVLSQADAEAMKAAPQGTFKPKDPVRTQPALMRDNAGLISFTACTAKANIPEAEQKKFRWVTLPAAQVFAAATADEKINSFSINPFTKENEIILSRTEMMALLAAVKSN